jgi:ketosteroid isomerase-like protein
MSLQTFAQRVVDLCNQRKNFDVMNTLYAADIVSVEPTGKQTVGQAAVIEKSKRWAAANEIHGEKVLGPYLHGADRFAMHITFEVTRKDTGKRVTLQEVAVYTVKNDLITREEFFFGGDSW